MGEFLAMTASRAKRRAWWSLTIDPVAPLATVNVAAFVLGVMAGLELDRGWVDDSGRILVPIVMLAGLAVRSGRRMAIIGACLLVSLLVGCFIANRWAQREGHRTEQLLIGEAVYMSGQIKHPVATEFGWSAVLDEPRMDRRDRAFSRPFLRLYLPAHEAPPQDGSRWSGWVNIRQQQMVFPVPFPLQAQQQRLKPPIYGTVKNWRLVDEVSFDEGTVSDLDPLVAELVDLFLRGRPAYRWRDILGPLGIGHLLAISGLHCMLVFGFIRLLVFWLRRPFMRSVVVIAALLVFATWMGWTPSVTRATLLLILWQLLPLTNAPRSWLRGWSAILVVLLASDPGLALSRGFWYTFAASLGVVCGIRHYPRSPLIHPWHGWIRYLLPVLSAQLFVMPINLMFTGRADPMSIVWNMLGLVFLVLLLAVTLLGSLSYVIALLAPVAEGLAHGLAGVCGWLDGPLGDWSLVRFPAPMLAVGFCLVVFAVFMVFGRREWRWYGLLVVSAIFLLWGKPKGEAAFVMLDVGQGQCCLVIDEDGNAIVLDAGGRLPWGWRLDTVLRLHGVTNVEAVFISHHNRDHLDLLNGLLAQIPVYVPATQMSQFSADPAFAKWQLQALHQGDEVQFAGLSVSTLWPDARIPSQSTNESGLVLEVRVGQYQALFAGDAGRPTESHLEGLAESVDVLQVGHHGSRSSSSAEFIRSLSPQVALVSCGRANRFGHPHRGVLEEYDRQGVRLWQTANHGSLRVVFGDSGLHVKTSYDRLPQITQ